MHISIFITHDHDPTAWLVTRFWKDSRCVFSIWALSLVHFRSFIRRRQILHQRTSDEDGAARKSPDASVGSSFISENCTTSHVSHRSSLIAHSRLVSLCFLVLLSLELALLSCTYF